MHQPFYPKWLGRPTKTLQRTHALVVDDVLLFRQRRLADPKPHEPADASAEIFGAVHESGNALPALLRRYAEVGLRTKPSKVHHYAPEQDLLGYRLDRNVLRSSASRYASLRDAVLLGPHCGFDLWHPPIAPRFPK